MRQREPALFLALTALFLIPVWWFDYFPSQDGPTHVYNARILAEFFWPADSPFRNFLYLNPRFDPTWFSHLILSGLMFVFPPAIAEKVLISIYVVSLPAAARYLVTGINPSQAFLSILVFPFVLNSLLHFGFYSYCLSLPALLLFIGYFYRHDGNWSARSLLVLATLSLLLYLLHIVALGVGYLSVAVLGLVSLWREDNRSWRATMDRGVKPLLAFLPTLILVVVFLGQRETVFVYEEDLAVKLRYMLLPMSLYSFRPVELQVAGMLALFLGGITIFAIHRRRKQGLKNADGLIAAALLVAVVSFFAPAPYVITEGSLAGGGFLRDRINPVPWLLLIAWLATAELGPQMRRLTQVAAVAASAFFLIRHTTSYAFFAPQIEDYVSVADRIERGSTLLPLNVSPGGLDSNGEPYSRKAGPFLHLGARIGAKTGAVVLQNYEAELGYFPLVYRSEMNPAVHLGQVGPTLHTPPRVDIRGYMAKTGVTVDYTLIWLGRKRQQDHEDVLDLYRQMERDFELIFTSASGRLELFRYAP